MDWVLKPNTTYNPFKYDKKSDLYPTAFICHRERFCCPRLVKFLMDNISYLKHSTLTALIRIEPVHEISNNVVCATRKASDQPAHMRSLIRALNCWSFEDCVIVKLLTEHDLEFLSLKGGCRGSSESTRQNATLLEITCTGSDDDDNDVDDDDDVNDIDDDDVNDSDDDGDDVNDSDDDFDGNDVHDVNDNDDDVDDNVNDSDDDYIDDVYDNVNDSDDDNGNDDAIMFMMIRPV